MRYKPCFNGYNGINRSHKTRNINNRNIKRSQSFLYNALLKKENLTQVLLCEFCKIRQNNVSAKHYRTTTSDYSGIYSSEGRIGKRNCKL